MAEEGLSQKSAAYQLKCSGAALSNWLNGKYHDGRVGKGTFRGHSLDHRVEAWLAGKCDSTWLSVSVDEVMGEIAATLEGEGEETLEGSQGMLPSSDLRLVEFSQDDGYWEPQTQPQSQTQPPDFTEPAGGAGETSPPHPTRGVASHDSDGFEDGGEPTPSLDAAAAPPAARRVVAVALESIEPGAQRGQPKEWTHTAPRTSDEHNHCTGVVPSAKLEPKQSEFRVGEVVYSAAHRTTSVAARERRDCYMFGRSAPDGEPATADDFVDGAVVYSRGVSARRASASKKQTVASEECYLWVSSKRSQRLIWIEGRFITHLTAAESEKIRRPAENTDPEWWRMAIGSEGSSLSEPSPNF